MTLGRNGFDGWLADDVCMGAIMGRNTSRIAGARCAIDGVDYRLAANDNGNNAHSGPHGFERALWRIDEDALAGSSVTLRLVSPHLSQGFPGTMAMAVTYTLADGALEIGFSAVSDRTTICNPTSHIYWNLDGNSSRGSGGTIPGATGAPDASDAPAITDALDHTLHVAADRYFPTDAGFLPLDVAPVDGTPFDFRQPRTPRAAMAAHPGDPQLAIGRGYNHAYDFAAAYAGLADGYRTSRRSPTAGLASGVAPSAGSAPSVDPSMEAGARPLIPMATLTGGRSGITMALSCDAPALVVYSAGWFDAGSGLPGRGGRAYGPGAGIALEPGFVPNAINDDHHGTTPSPLLRAGDRFRMTIRYAFHA